MPTGPIGLHYTMPQLFCTIPFPIQVHISTPPPNLYHGMIHASKNIPTRALQCIVTSIAQITNWKVHNGSQGKDSVMGKNETLRES